MSKFIDSFEAQLIYKQASQPPKYNFDFPSMQIVDIVSEDVATFTTRYKFGTEWSVQGSISNTKYVGEELIKAKNLAIAMLRNDIYGELLTDLLRLNFNVYYDSDKGGSLEILNRMLETIGMRN